MTTRVMLGRFPGQCRKTIEVRDTYRCGAPGKSRSEFYLHYKKQRCSRMGDASGFCWQHREKSQP